MEPSTRLKTRMATSTAPNNFFSRTSKKAVVQSPGEGGRGGGGCGNLLTDGFDAKPILEPRMLPAYPHSRDMTIRTETGSHRKPRLQLELDTDPARLDGATSTHFDLVPTLRVPIYFHPGRVNGGPPKSHPIEKGSVNDACLKHYKSTVKTTKRLRFFLFHLHSLGIHPPFHHVGVVVKNRVTRQWVTLVNGKG